MTFPKNKQATLLLSYFLLSCLLSPSLAQSYTLSTGWTSANPILGVVHSPGSFEDGILKLDSAEIPAHPRIQGAYLAEEDSPTEGSITPPPFQLTTSEEPLTLTWINAELVAAPISDLGVAVSPSGVFKLPTQFDILWRSYNDQAGVTPEANDDSYVFRHFYVKNNEASTQACTYDISFTGSIRALYVNDAKVTYIGTVNGANPDRATPTAFESTNIAKLLPGLLNVITIIGSEGTQLTSFQFNDCITASLEYYVSDNEAILTQQIIGPETATLSAPTSPVTQVQQDDDPTSCEFPFYWKDYACTMSCSVASFDRVCTENSYSTFIISESYPSTTSHDVEVYLDFDTTESDTHIMLPTSHMDIDGLLYLGDFANSNEQQQTVVIERGQRTKQHVFESRYIDYFNDPEIYVFQEVPNIFVHQVSYSSNTQIGIPGTYYSFDPREDIIASFFLRCFTPPCNLEIISNDVSQWSVIVVNGIRKFQGAIGPFDRVIQVEDVWSTGEEDYDTHFVRVEMWSNAGLQIRIVSGYYKIFAPGPLLGRIAIDKAELEELDCSDTLDGNCDYCNSDATICYECNDDDVVGTDGDCIELDQCDDVGLIGDIYNLTCIASCPDGFIIDSTTASGNPDYCVFGCPPGTRLDFTDCVLCDDGCEACDATQCTSNCGHGTYTDGADCVECPEGCKVCDDTFCYFCEDGYILSNDGLCKLVVEYSAISSYRENLWACQSLFIQIEIHQHALLLDESRVLLNEDNSIQYTHTVSVSGNEDTDFQTDLKALVSEQTDYFIEIPEDILQHGKYVFYTSVFSVDFQFWDITSVVYVSDERKLLILNAGDVSPLPVQITKIDLVLESFFTSLCLYNEQLEEYPEWTQLSGLDLSESTIPSQYDPMDIEIDGCAFEFDETYLFYVEVEFQSIVWSANIELIGTVPDLNLRPFIGNGNRFNHQQSNDLILQGGHEMLIGLCDHLLEQIASSTSYTWYCEKEANTPCDDPEDIFEVSSTTEKSLTVPGSYLSTLGEEYVYTLKTEILGQTFFAISSSVVIGSPNSFTVQLSCSTERNCAEYVNSGWYIFEVFEVDEGEQQEFNQDFTYEWTVSESSIEIIPFFNQIKLIENMNLFSNQFLTIEVVVTDTSTSQTTTAAVILPINGPPDQGTLTVSPNQGQALLTEFTIQTLDWNDDYYPVTYQFSYERPDGRKSLINKRFRQKSLTTILPLISIEEDDGSQELTIHAQIFDFLLSIAETQTSIKVTKPYDTVNDAISGINEMIDGLETEEDMTLEEIFREIQIISATLSTLEEEFQELATPVQSAFLILAKEKMLNTLKNAIDGLVKDDNYEDCRRMVIDALYSTSKSTIFNTYDTLIQTQEILESVVDMEDEKDILGPENSETVVDLVDNFVNFAKENDCIAETKFTEDLSSKTSDYLQKSGRSNLAELVINQAPVIYIKGNFDTYVVKVRPEDLESLEIQTQEGTPAITFHPDPNFDYDQFEEFSIQYYVFRNNTFDCEGGEGLKEIMIFIIEDKNGDPVTDLPFTFKPGSDEMGCPKGCTCTDPEQEYECDDIEFFDIESQLGRIFENSNLGLLTNVDAFKNFRYWETATFWGLVVFTTWLGGSVVLVSFKLKNFCGFQQFLKKTNKTHKKALGIAMMASHPMLGAYYYKDPNIPKVQKIGLYYTRLLLLLAYISIFQEASNQDISDYTFNVYLIILPYFTYYPIYLIVEILVETDQQQIQKKGKKAKFLKIKSYIGLFLMIGILAGCYYIVLIIAAQQNNNQRKVLGINLATVAFQDMIFSPIVLFGFQYLLIKYQAKKGANLGKKEKKITDAIIGKQLLKIKDDLTKIGIYLSGYKKESISTQIVSDEEIVKELKTEKKDIPAIDSANSIDLDLGKEQSDQNNIKAIISRKDIGTKDYIGSQNQAMQKTLDGQQTIQREGIKTGAFRGTTGTMKNISLSESALDEPSHYSQNESYHDQKSVEK